MTDENQTSDNTMFDMNKKKKSSKKRLNRELLLETTNTTESRNNIVDNVTTAADDFTYDKLLNRAFDMIHHPEGEDDNTYESGKFRVPVPIVARVGTIRTSFTNFGVICKYLKRSEKCLYDYFLTETGAKASIDAGHALVIRGRYGLRDIESILRKFIKEYVICKSCHSPDTSLGKSDRLTMLKCETCHSQYSVSSIKSGFQAQTGRRQRQNNQ